MVLEPSICTYIIFPMNIRSRNYFQENKKKENQKKKVAAEIALYINKCKSEDAQRKPCTKRCMKK